MAVVVHGSQLSSAEGTMFWDKAFSDVVCIYCNTVITVNRLIVVNPFQYLFTTAGCIRNMIMSVW